MQKIIDHKEARKEQPSGFNLMALLALASIFIFLFNNSTVSAIPATTNVSSSGLGIPTTKAVYPTPQVYFQNITVNNSQFFDGYTTQNYNTTFIQTPISQIYSNLSSYVPYLGASRNVDLNNFNLTNVQRIGVGTSSPRSKLDVVGGDINLDSGESLLWGVGNDQINFDGTAFRHLVGGAVRMRLTTTGLMIGQDSNPTRALDVNGNVIFNTTTIRQPTAGASQLILQNHTGNAAWEITNVNKDLAFYNYGAATQPFYIQGTTNNIGIGTTNPSRTLDVRGLGNFSGELYVQNGTAVSPWLYNQTFDTTNLTASYVPYVGANRNVNLIPFNLTTTNILLNNSIISTKDNIRNFSNISAVINSIVLGSFTGVNHTNKSSIIRSGAEGIVIGRLSSGLGASQNNTMLLDLNSGAGSLVLGSADPGLFNSNVANTIQAVSSGASLVVGYISGGSNTSNTIATSTTGTAGSLVVGRISSPANAGASSINDGGAGGSIVVGRVERGAITNTGNGARGALIVGAVNSGGTITNLAAGGLNVGFISSNNSFIASNSNGCLIHGYILSSGVSNNISCGLNFATLASGQFVHGFISGGSNNFIEALSNASVAIGRPNISITGVGAMAFGQNLNITGTNSIGFGLNSLTLKEITQNNAFVINDAEIIYFNGTTNPSIKLGQAQEISIQADTTGLVINPKTVGAGNVSIRSTLNVIENLTVSNNTYFQSGVFASNKKGLTLDITFTNATGDCFMNFTSGLLTGTVC